MKKNIAIIGGGYSGEYEISIRSSEVVSRHLDKQRYNAYQITVTDTDWFYRDAEGNKHLLNKDQFTLEMPSGRVSFDAIFNAIHGTPGEDGRLQVLFDEIGIPCTSCDVVSSALTFNKYFCNCFVNTIGILTARSMLIRYGEEIKTEEIIEDVGLPCFIKPNKGGSSVGVSRVNNADDIVDAVKMALEEDDEVIIEEFIPGREITCGVLILDGHVMALPITEIVSKNEFFDYEAKYEGKSDELIPAPVSKEIEKQCKELSLKLYAELSCRGVIRCDYIFNDHGMYFLEVNTIPGLTEESIVPQQAREAGITLQQMFTDIIEQSLENHQAWL